MVVLVLLASCMGALRAFGFWVHVTFGRIPRTIHGRSADWSLECFENPGNSSSQSRPAQTTARGCDDNDKRIKCHKSPTLRAEYLPLQPNLALINKSQPFLFGLVLTARRKWDRHSNARHNMCVQLLCCARFSFRFISNPFMSSDVVAQRKKNICVHYFPAQPNGNCLCSKLAAPHKRNKRKCHKWTEY